MATNQGPEGVRLAIVATLNSFLATKLSNLNATYNDGLALTAPRNIYAYEQGSISELPLVQVFSMGGAVQIDGATAWQQMGHEVVIQWFVTSDTVQNLQKATDRYALAIQQVLQEHKDLDGTVDGGTGIILTKYQIGAMAKETRRGLYMQTGAWYATFEAVEMLR